MHESVVVNFVYIYPIAMSVIYSISLLHFKFQSYLNKFFNFFNKTRIVLPHLGEYFASVPSQLKAILLLAVAKRPIIKKYGINCILENFMEDLAELEQVCNNSIAFKVVSLFVEIFSL